MHTSSLPAFDSARSVLQTGDVVLFAGNTPFSLAIEAATGSRWTHVGMVVKTTKQQEVLLWESLPYNNVRDVETGKYAWGVQLVSLSKRLDKHDADVCFRRLEWS